MSWHQSSFLNRQYNETEGDSVRPPVSYLNRFLSKDADCVGSYRMSTRQRKREQKRASTVVQIEDLCHKSSIEGVFDRASKVEPAVALSEEILREFDVRKVSHNQLIEVAVLDEVWGQKLTDVIEKPLKPSSHFDILEDVLRT